MIIVTGVHRSGTSLLAMTVEALGVDFGPHTAFYPADRWNERGYFERRDVMDLNSRILTGFSRSGGRVPRSISKLRYLAMPRLEVIQRRAEALDREITTLAERLDRLAVKDPRFCLTLPAWKARGNVTACLVCVRDPTEVALSLRRRQRVPMSWGYAFWAYHVRHLLEHLPTRTLLVEHGQLVGNDYQPEIRRVAEFLGLDIGGRELSRRFRSLRETDLVHASRRVGGAGLPRPVQELWDRLQDLRAQAAAGSR